MQAVSDPAPVRRPWTDDEVSAALVKLWFRTRWERLEVGCNKDGYTGYCINRMQEYPTRETLGNPQCPAEIIALARLLDASGWQRLEIVSATGKHAAGGWCERADGSGLHVSWSCG